MDIETGKISNENYEDASDCEYARANERFESHCDDDNVIIESSKCPERRYSADGIAINEAALLANCPICLENPSTENPLIRSDKCGHAWCQECLLDYCEFQISNHRVPLPCPSSAHSRHKDDGGCHEQLPPYLVRNILISQQDTFLVEKFDRLERMAQDPSLVACPRCSELVESTSTSTTTTTQSLITDSNARVCRKCEHTFCSLHLDAHLGTRCQDYVHAMIRLPPNTKPCSHCGAALQKYAGCDHVVCPACQDDMCFRCGTHVHLTGKVTRFCTQCEQGYLDHRYLWQIRLYYCLTLPFALPFVLAYSVVMIGVVLLTFCCCGCFGCGRWLSNDKGKRNPADVPRAFLYVTFIISLPFLLMLYDGGYRFDIVDEFLEWSLVEVPATNPEENAQAEREVLPATPTSSNVSNE